MCVYIFKRYELKYLISKSQFNDLILLIENNMKKDEYGASTIQSLYYDTDTYQIIRRSLEKPAYKEKLRLRSYNQVKDGDTVFVELKKKSDGVVYKRRSEYTFSSKNDFSLSDLKNSQIDKEIDYFINYYKNLSKKFLLIYDRLAYFGKDNLRVTFDTNIRYRVDNLSLNNELVGKKILDDDLLLMEIKANSSFPMWLVKELSELQIKKVSFSKYGTAYKDFILTNKGGQNYV